MTATLDDVAARHGFSDAAALVALDALRRGPGGMGQFDHPDLGGQGQWMSGIVTIGRVDPALKARVAALFADLATLGSAPDPGRPDRTPTHRSTMEPMKPMEPMNPMAPMKPMSPMKPMAPMTSAHVDAPKDWGEPASAGGQDNVRYAYFSRPNRLVVETDGSRVVYDTADHAITGVAQDQSDLQSGRLVFTSQHGPVALDTLNRVGS